MSAEKTPEPNLHVEFFAQQRRQGRGFRRHSDEVVRNVKQRLADGLSAREVARETGMPYGTVRSIADGRTHSAVVVPQSRDCTDA